MIKKMQEIQMIKMIQIIKMTMMIKMIQTAKMTLIAETKNKVQKTMQDQTMVMIKVILEIITLKSNLSSDLFMYQT